MRIVYCASSDAVNFDIDRYYKSLNRYGKVARKQIEETLENLHYDPMHVSVLVEIGAQLIPDEKQARRYYEEHKNESGNFERLRRITGYLVGSLERWNDGKKAEEQDRVKHGVYSQENKDRLEAEKLEVFQDAQNEYHKEAKND